MNNTLWEENDSIEQSKKSENKLIFALNDGISEIKNVSAKSVCENIGNKKKWVRNCPRCNCELVYKHACGWCTANKLESLCKNCWRIYPSKREKKWERNCPRCYKLLFYTTKKQRDKMEKTNTLCKSCAFSGKPKSENHRKKLSIALKGRKLSDEMREKIRIGLRNLPEEKKMEMARKISAAGKGRPSHRKGKQLTKEWKMNIRNGLLNMAPELKQKVIDGNKNRKISDESRRKMRLAAIKNIELKKFGGAQMKPAFNFKACQYFDELSKQNNWNLQHAMNGGEYYLKNLGYWVDAYDKDKNIVIEYDEGYHNKKKEDDARRMNEIKQYLKCKFYRYDAVAEELKEY